LQYLVGRRLLVGISYRDGEGELLHQEQYCGTVLEVVDGVVVVDRPGHEQGPAVLPADAQAYDPAPRGRYVLGITGDVVQDPDFVTTWDVVAQEPGAPPPDAGGPPA
jgi:hypothetical protein